MPRQTGVQVDSNFSKGLITEASGLSYPPNSCTETFDCIHKPIGNVLRRKGFNTELNFSMKQVTRGNAVITSYLWRDVAGNGNVSIFAQQIGSTIYFYNASTSGPLSSSPYATTINLIDYSPGGAPNPSTYECQYAAGNGKLFVCNPVTESFYVEFNPDTSVFTVTEITVEARDFDGLDDGLAVDNRPTISYAGLSINHHYNLLNQGWNNTQLQAWDTAQSNMPSNADQMWRFRNSTGDLDYSTTTTNKNILSNSPAPKGHFVLNIYNKDRATPTGLSISNQTTGYNRASSIAFFSGRVFYSGIAYPGFQSKIFFSPIIERDSQIGQCYQQNDPTGEDLFDLLSTDGGVIVIQEAGTILKMLNVPGGLCVFASNGVWLITGSTGLGFTASDYTVSKISSYQTLSATSFVDIAGSIVWWNLEGIYKLDGSGQSFNVQSLTEQTIKTFYNNIPSSEKKSARGYFNPVLGVAQWLYKSTPSGDVKSLYEFDRILNLDTNTGAWYVWTIPVHNVKIHGLTVLENRGGAITEEAVTDNSLAVVTDNSSNTVTAYIIGQSIVAPNYKYITSFHDGNGDEQFTFSEARDINYIDWAFTLNDLKTYDSTFTSGYKIAGDAIKDFQSNYVRFFSDTNSAYTVRGVWDYATSSDSNRWSQPQTINTVGTSNFRFASKRLKIRGRGRTLQIKASSVGQIPFDISGWSVFLSSNTVP